MQPLEVKDNPHLPDPLPDDVLEPMGPHKRIEPTKEELSFKSKFLHYVVQPEPYRPAPKRKPLHFIDSD